jgi:type II secretory ATPase GspE/PulE/Tfp pilus assembly ATPase PilB-like protein/GAF domain-containing protein
MAFFSKLMRSAKPRDPRYGSASSEDSFPHDFEDQTVTNGTSLSENADISLINAELEVLIETGTTQEQRETTFEEKNEKATVRPDKNGISEPAPQQERREGRRASDQIKPLINKILSAESTKDLLFSLTEDLKNIFKSEAVSIYSLDRGKRQLYACNYQNPGEMDFRLDISPKSLAGFCAATGKSLNIVDVYSSDELKQYDPNLIHNKTWDNLTHIKTSSALVVALPYEKRVVGVLQVLNKTGEDRFSEGDLRQAKELATTLGHAMVKLEIEEVEAKFKATAHAIHSAKNSNDILLGLKETIMDLFDAEMITIYAIDSEKNEIFSKFKSDNIIKEIRVPISSKSIAGWVALEKRPINIADVYNQEDLKKYNPEITFDSSWNKKSGLKTKSMLVYPLVHNDKTMGVLQLINKKYGESFTKFDQKNILIIADHLALAFNNQQNTSQKKKSKFGYLVENGIVSQEELNEAILKARENKLNIEDVLLGELKLKRKDIGKSLELYYEIPYSGYSDSVVLHPNVFAELNKNYLAKHDWVPIQNSPSNITILIDDPTDQDKVNNIRMILPKKNISFHVGLKADIRDFLNTGISGESPLEEESEENNKEELSTLLNALVDEQSDSSADYGSSDDDAVNAISETDSTIVRLVNKIMTDAYDQGISDIHVEPGVGKKDVKVRFRKDGTCRIYQQIPYLYKQAIISRLKIMARLDIAEKKMPQDGKIKMKYGRKEIEFRVATCPTVGGNEDAVMRILASSKPIPLEEMSFSTGNLNWIKEKIAMPYGLILVVGPTGSGKTTTLHSCLGHINTSERKIWTAEDPVEITQEGLRQVQMLDKIGLNFARAMRSFLRGDPDVIMVGEMRDSETAAIALEASLTGHLVFSTLHTNSAPETITRLIDMGMNALNFADAILLIVAQRLVKTLCKECKEDYHPDKSEFEILVQEYGEEDFKKLDIKYTKELQLKKPVGCQKCIESGYSGRMALHEVLKGTPEMKSKIMHKAFVTELRDLAKQEGMTTLKQDGIQKVFQGHCDLKQVLTVSAF